MPPKPEPTTCYQCSEVQQTLRDMAKTTGRMEGTLDAILAQATKTNGSVAELFQKSSTHRSRLDLHQDRLTNLETAAAESKKAWAIWADRAWKLLVAIGLLWLASTNAGCNHTAIQPATARARRTITVRIEPQRKSEPGYHRGAANTDKPIETRRIEPPKPSPPASKNSAPLWSPAEIRIAGETIAVPPGAAAQITVEIETDARSAAVTTTNEQIQLADLKAPSVSLPPSAAADAGSVGGFKATAAPAGRMAVAALAALAILAGALAWIWLGRAKLGIALIAGGVFGLAAAHLAAQYPLALFAVVVLAAIAAAVCLIDWKKAAAHWTALRAVARGVEASPADAQTRVKMNIETAAKATGREESIRRTIRKAKGQTEK